MCAMYHDADGWVDADGQFKMIVAWFSESLVTVVS